eukprot:Filipodium_phascolosomae@DN2745_c1_g1_i19.p1
MANACGQLRQSYQDYECPEAEKHMECAMNPSMETKAVTTAIWWGAPGPFICGPKSKYPKAGAWDIRASCHKPWLRPPQFCTEYPGQKGGAYDWNHHMANRAGRVDLENCCWWGRGVIQTTGRCNFGKLNYYLGAKAAQEGRPSRYPDVDFCVDPESICTSDKYKELKWVAGFFYWLNSVQSYSQGGWTYMKALQDFVGGGMQGDGFIYAVSGIVNRGCHNPPCRSGDVDGFAERRANFLKVLKALKIEGRRPGDGN